MLFPQVHYKYRVGTHAVLQKNHIVTNGAKTVQKLRSRALTLNRRHHPLWIEHRENCSAIKGVLFCKCTAHVMAKEKFAIE